MKIVPCVQGDETWLAMRLGLPTASEFKKIVTPVEAKFSKTARSFAIRLVAEKLLNQQVIDFEETEWMSRGKDLEFQAVKAYELQTDVTTSQIGFVLADNERYGASPDRLVGETGLLEIKVPAPHTHLGYLLDGFDQDYRPQVQGQLLVCEREWDDWVSYHHIWPMVRVRAPRDEFYILKLKSALEQFCELRDELERRARLLGLFPAPKAPVSAAAVALSQLDGDPVMDALDELLPPERTVVQVATPVGPPRPREESPDDVAFYLDDGTPVVEGKPFLNPERVAANDPELKRDDADHSSDIGVPARTSPGNSSETHARPSDQGGSDRSRGADAGVSGTIADPALAAWWAAARRARSYHLSLSSRNLSTEGRDKLIRHIAGAPDVEALASFQDANHKNISERIAKASLAAANDVRAAIARRLAELNR